MRYGYAPPYNFVITLWKALWTYLGSVGVIGAAEVLSVGTPESFEAFAAQWPRYVIALAPAIWKVVENVRKNWRDDGAPLWSWPWAALTPKP